jgi:TonB family protein
MVTRVKRFCCLAPAIVIAVATAAGDPTPTPKPVRGTLEYAKKHVLYAPRPILSPVILSKRLTGAGIFALHVRPDGTVSAVDVLRSTGHDELDSASIAALYKWRFYPGQFKVVRVPLTYTSRYGR